MKALETGHLGRRHSADLKARVSIDKSPRKAAHDAMYSVMRRTEEILPRGGHNEYFILNNHKDDATKPAKGDYSYALLLHPAVLVSKSVISLEVFPKQEDPLAEAEKKASMERAEREGAFVLREGTLNISERGVIEHGKGVVLDTDLAMQDVLHQFFGLPLTIQVDSDLQGLTL